MKRAPGVAMDLLRKVINFPYRKLEIRTVETLSASLGAKSILNRRSSTSCVDPARNQHQRTQDGHVMAD